MDPEMTALWDTWLEKHSSGGGKRTIEICLWDINSLKSGWSPVSLPSVLVCQFSCPLNDRLARCRLPPMDTRLNLELFLLPFSLYIPCETCFSTGKQHGGQCGREMARAWALTSLGSGPGSCGYIPGSPRESAQSLETPVLRWQKGMTAHTS